MKIIVERNLKLSKYKYYIKSSKKYYAESNHTFGLLPRKIRVFDEKRQIIYYIKQKNFLLSILLSVITMFLPFIVYKVFEFYNKDVYKGKTYPYMFNHTKIINFDDCKYELYVHSNNYISIMKNGIQIGLIKKQNITIEEKNTYIVLYDETMESDMAFIFSLTVFVDVCYFKNRLRIDYYRYEKTVGKDKLYERTLWRP